MKVLGIELGGGVDTSAYDFRDDLITELEKCIEIPFAMNSFTESRLFGQQECLKDIIEYLKQII
jgi:hypothetical protein